MSGSIRITWSISSVDLHISRTGGWWWTGTTSWKWTVGGRRLKNMGLIWRMNYEEMGEQEDLGWGVRTYSKGVKVKYLREGDFELIHPLMTWPFSFKMNFRFFMCTKICQFVSIVLGYICRYWVSIVDADGLVCYFIDALEKERPNSSALAMELHLSCTNPSTCTRASTSMMLRNNR